MSTEDCFDHYLTAVRPPTLIKLLAVWMNIRPPATAGVLCVTSPKGFLARTWNRSEASTTTTSPLVGTQYNRRPTQRGELKKLPPTRSCHFTSPEAACTQLTIPPSLHRKSHSPTQTLVGT